jgi:ferredoxin-type protein NapF
MISRRDFLRGDFGGRRTPPRPPWALAEREFLEACTACGECVRACPQKILVAVRGLPVVDFARGACTFCGACVEACRPGALSAAERAEGRAPWRLRARIGASCVAYRNVSCQICLEACEVRAIRLESRVGAAALPDVLTGICTGCGACVAPCPTHAITLTAE